MASRRQQTSSRSTSAAEPASKPVESAESAFGPEFEALVKSNGETMNTLVKANEAALRGLVALSQEILEFGNARLRENLDRTQSLSKCRDLEEALNVQSGFFQSATEQYLKESANLMKLMTDISQEYWAPVEDRTKEVLEELSPK